MQPFEPNGNFVYWRSLQTCTANTDQISTGRQNIRTHTGSTSGKSIAQSQRTSKKAKRVDIQFLYTQQLTRDGIISIHKINTTNNTADFSQSTSLEGSFSVCNTLQDCTRALWLLLFYMLSIECVIVNIFVNILHVCHRTYISLFLNISPFVALQLWLINSFCLKLWDYMFAFWFVSYCSLFFTTSVYPAFHTKKTTMADQVAAYNDICTKMSEC